MDDYTKQLEERLEELQEKLANAEKWKPQWIEHTIEFSGKVFYVYRSDTHEFGRVNSYASTTEEGWVCTRGTKKFTTSDEAKRYVEKNSIT
jgi:hypothetical protein